MDKTIFESVGGFLKVKSAETTPYFYAERKGVDSVAFILLDENRSDKYGVVNERKPPMDERFGELAFIETAFGGSNDIIDDEKYFEMTDEEVIDHLKQIVKMEAREEGGYDVDMSKIKFISKELVSTQMNQWAFLFVVNVTGVKQGKTDPQNAEEAMATIRWKNFKQVQRMNDWKTKTIIFNLI
jgi:hypothetical protein